MWSFKSRVISRKIFFRRKCKKSSCEFIYSKRIYYATPVSVDETAIVITCSLGGNTPETVKATSKAKELGAHVIAVTHTPNSPITKDADYVVEHGFEASYSAKLEKMTKVLTLAVEILNQFEGYKYYDKMVSGLDKIYGLIDQAVTTVVPQA